MFAVAEFVLPGFGGGGLAFAGGGSTGGALIGGGTITGSQILTGAGILGGSTLFMSGAWRPPGEWADLDHGVIRDEVRRLMEGFESGRHNMYPREMVRRLTELANSAERQGVLEGYVNRLRQII